MKVGGAHDCILWGWRCSFSETGEMTELNHGNLQLSTEIEYSGILLYEGLYILYRIVNNPAGSCLTYNNSDFLLYDCLYQYLESPHR